MCALVLYYSWENRLKKVKVTQSVICCVLDLNQGWLAPSPLFTYGIAEDSQWLQDRELSTIPGDHTVVSYIFGKLWAREN